MGRLSGQTMTQPEPQDLPFAAAEITREFAGWLTHLQAERRMSR